MVDLTCRPAASSIALDAPEAVPCDVASL